ncbi:transcriptional regulator, GntR family [Thalassolituus maritimus]|uniref:Transcriptional regulator, GntR family n=1 Tax=Thalassolituus maritimus TaxID=484498 RepID=A0A1N7KQ46_9GAMM|nr:GntR family transcriptional regulator [Thalassolituus maritimus]SIS63616.1 transcriptional regulator, GntR family [Thalassolituus maritimus]
MTHSPNLSLYVTPPGSKATSRDEQIVRELLQAIVDRRLRPGTRLPEDSLGEAFKVSRTTIRKALQKLAQQRLVSMEHNRGARVAQPGRKEAADVFKARRLIEVALIPAVYENRHSDAYKELHDLVAQEKAAHREGKFQEEVQLSARFHVQLAVATGNLILGEQVAQLTSLSSLIISLYGTSSSVGCDCGEHTELLKLIESNQVAEAQTWMDHHLDAIYQTINTTQDSGDDVDFKSMFSA